MPPLYILIHTYTLLCLNTNRLDMSKYCSHHILVTSHFGVISRVITLTCELIQLPTSQPANNNIPPILNPKG